MQFVIPGGFARVLARLGIADPRVVFKLNDTVVPVSLVDTDLTIPTSTLPPLFGSPASAGEINNPAANTRMADTGPLPAGNYYVVLIRSHTAGSINTRLKRRDAADAADVWSQTFAATASTNDWYPGIHVNLLANERIVAEHVSGGVGGITQCSLWVNKTS